MKRKSTILPPIFIVAIFIFLVLYSLFGNSILKSKVDWKIKRFNQNHSLTISYMNVRLNGLTTVTIDSIFITDINSYTIFFAPSLTAQIRILPLIHGKFILRKLLINNAFCHIDLAQAKSYITGNYDTVTSTNTQKSSNHYNQRFSRLIKRVFESIPSKLSITNTRIHFIKDSATTGFIVNSLIIKRSRLIANVDFDNGSLECSTEINGKISQRHNRIEISVNPVNKDQFIYSPLAPLTGSSLKYQSLSISFITKELKGRQIQLSGKLKISNFDIQNEHIAVDTIEFKECSLDYLVNVGINYIELDSLSQARFGDLTFRPFLKIIKGQNDSLIGSFKIMPFTGEDFFNSFPPNLFSNLKNIKSEGTLSYSAKLAVNLNDPDSLILLSELGTRNFKILGVDKELYKLNNDFQFNHFEKRKLTRSIWIGRDNPNFRTLDEIPELLQRSVLLAEDDAFFYHKGFLNESIRYAIVQNLKKGKLFRGGSTISQQLVKNIYLSGEKTISRKLEEVILVWLIESKRLVSKERMFEVYLNIIEWGPNVYGVAEASRFYFKKDVSILTVEECIFLASVIPSPKKFHYRFDKEGNLAPFMKQYYKDMAEKLQWRGLIYSTNGDSLSSLLKIQGPAKDFLHSGTIIDDSLKFASPSVVELFEEPE